jgi:hypothetical protein
MPDITGRDDADEEVGRLARFYDVTILEQADPDRYHSSNSGTIETATFRSDRLVIAQTWS